MKVAKNSETGLYFDGVIFGADAINQATPFPDEVSPPDIQYAWDCPVALEAAETCPECGRIKRADGSARCCTAEDLAEYKVNRPKPKFVKKDAKITMVASGNESSATITFQVMALGDYGYRKNTEGNEYMVSRPIRLCSGFGDYAVTHIPSGGLVMSGLSYRGARDLCVALQDLEPWNGRGKPPETFCKAISKLRRLF